MTGEGRHPDRVPLHEGALSLPPAAVGQPVRPLDPPVPVLVWVPRARFGWARLEAVATAYTPTAGHVRYRDEHGREGVAWVWAGAITRR
ncbi:hypothetical protein [Actinotalea caeni]|uniref:hypothetical protein n=1 Tax=Actinotalea caeni TaxID=1348467 RepID=UPI0012E0E490|nr:hypothetical protein [Actinotalea caeni]